MLKGVTQVFFDLDHTLWDFERNSALTFEKIFQETDIPVDITDFLEVYVPANRAFWKLYREGKITKDRLRYERLSTVFDTLGHPLPKTTIDTLSESYINHLSGYTHLFPNTVAILEYLKPRYGLHIITNGFGEIQERKLRNSHISTYFEQVINSELAGVKKPDPRIFRMALERTGIEPKQGVMIGDDLEADVLGARAVGLHALHFIPNGGRRHGICAVIGDLLEIKSFF
ncbi:MAG: YjjG family noncanonical pyrimidine nucleotidase [Bacteroidota bacterium]